MKAQKEAEKPFYWEHVHPEVKELSIEEIEKKILEGGVPAEKLADMTKNEKYLAISEGCYVLECEEADKVSAELESLKKDVERSKTSILNQPVSTQGQGQQAVAVVAQEEEMFEPIEFGKKPVIQTPVVPSVIDSVPSPAEGVMTNTSPLDSPVPNSTMPMMPAEKVNDPFNSPLSGGGAGGTGAGAGKAELRRHAQSIVAKVVSDVNAKADGVPDDVAVMKEQELLQAVIQELQTLK